MDVFMSHRELQSSSVSASAFSDEVAPFMDDGHATFDNRSACVIQSPCTLVNAHLLPTAQKLRPVRFYGRSSSPDYANPPDNNLFSSNQGSETNFESGYFPPLQSFHAALPADGAGNGSSCSMAGHNDAAVNINAKAGIRHDDSFIFGLKRQISQFSYSSDGFDDGMPESQRRKKRKKLESFLESLVMQLLEKQEQMHKQFIEVLEKKEAERVMREQVWRDEQMKQAKREEEIRSQERSRSMAIISYLQSVLSGNKNDNYILDPHQHNNPLQQSFSPSNSIMDIGQIPSPPSSTSGDVMLNGTISGDVGGGGGSCRWPKSEVLALVRLRAAFDRRFHSSGSKALVWEDISAGMAGMGYSRSGKKCKEKWENMTKYFKRTYGSGKKRPKNAKSCPYFHELEVLYGNEPDNSSGKSDSGTGLGGEHQEL